MELSDYTTYADVRAALGVSQDEIGDDVLKLQLYEDNLKMEMDNIGDTFIDEYDALLRATTRSTDENKLVRAGRLFCTYVVANHLLSSLPLFSPKEIGDGKASFQRYADSPYQETIKQVRARYAQYVASVSEAYAKLSLATSVRSTPSLMRVAGLGTNPITG